MSGREEILSAIRARTRPFVPKPAPYIAPALKCELVAGFALRS